MGLMGLMGLKFDPRYMGFAQPSKAAIQIISLAPESTLWWGSNGYVIDPVSIIVQLSVTLSYHIDN
jgi:hypothetical protein